MAVDYQAAAAAAATKHGLNPAIFVKQIGQESGFDPAAVSPAGAQGIAQFMPGTAEQLGVDPSDPLASLDAAARYMSTLLTNNKGSYPLALAAYNAGQGAVDQYGGVPPYAETQQYVASILGDSLPVTSPVTPSVQSSTGAKPMTTAPSTTLPPGTDIQSIIGWLINQQNQQQILDTGNANRANSALTGYYDPTNMNVGSTPTLANQQWQASQAQLDRQYYLDVAKLGQAQATINYNAAAQLASQRGPSNALAYNYLLNNKFAPLGTQQGIPPGTPALPADTVTPRDTAASQGFDAQNRATMLAQAYNSGDPSRYGAAGGTGAPPPPANTPPLHLEIGTADQATAPYAPQTNGAPNPNTPANPTAAQANAALGSAFAGAGGVPSWVGGFAGGGTVKGGHSFNKLTPDQRHQLMLAIQQHLTSSNATMQPPAPGAAPTPPTPQLGMPPQMADGGELDSSRGGFFPPMPPEFEQPSFPIGGKFPPEQPPASLDHISFDADGGTVGSEPSGSALAEYLQQMTSAGRGDEATSLLAQHGYSQQAPAPAAAPMDGSPPAAPAAQPSIDTWYDNGDLSTPVSSPAAAPAPAAPAASKPAPVPDQSPADIQRSIETLSGDALQHYLGTLKPKEYDAWASSVERAKAGEPIGNTIAAAGAGLAGAGGLGILNAIIAPLLDRGESVASKLGGLRGESLASRFGAAPGESLHSLLGRADGGPVAPVAIVGDSHSGRPTGYEEMAIALPPKGGQSRVQIEPLSKTNDPRETGAKIQFLDRMDAGGTVATTTGDATQNGNLTYQPQDYANSPTIQKINGTAPAGGAFGATGLNYTLPGTSTALPQGNRLNFSTYSSLAPSEQQFLQGLVTTPSAMGGLGLDWNDYLAASKQAAPTGVTFGGDARYG